MSVLSPVLHTTCTFDLDDKLWFIDLIESDVTVTNISQRLPHIMAVKHPHGTDML